MESRIATSWEKTLSAFDLALILSLAVFLVASLFTQLEWIDSILAGLSFLGLLPVAHSAIQSLLKRQISVDLLATIALVFSLLSHEWFSACFITLMLAFARLFDRRTEARAKNVIARLMKYHVERVRIRSGETIREVHVREVKPGDHVIVDTGDRMPVDGIVVSGSADIDESSLTGESELVQKKIGDMVHTATVNESGSLEVKALRVGDDTTLAHILQLVDEAGRSKNKAERTAEKFTKWYISLAFLACIAMYLAGLPSKIILAVLLVVCADDIAVAVPLTFTAAIMRAGQRGVIVKGSATLEQLSRVRYILTDKTGTLTRGKPKVVGIKTYGSWTEDRVIERLGMGSSESRHMVSRAILEYLRSRNIAVHAPHELKEIPGQGIMFRHGDERMLLGRVSFMEENGVNVAEKIKKEIEEEKMSGRGIAMLAVNGEVAGIVSYSDEIRPKAEEIIAGTRELGIKEWHMLTGDSEEASKAVARELGIRHFHSNMTPESKLEFIRRFEAERKVGEAVAYIGDGVNDSAGLALADVSIAMGGIGSDSAIEASDMTIMKDHLSRVPEMIEISKKVMGVMRWNFIIWAVTNAVGLSLVLLGIIGPAGASTYNFLTDFIPIGNALRAGRSRVSKFKD